jgi:hypothetical protein
MWGTLYCRIVPITGVSGKWKALQKLDFCISVAAEVIREFVYRDDELAAAGALQVFVLYPRAAK